jgi:hypothetical protein
MRRAGTCTFKFWNTKTCSESYISTCFIFCASHSQLYVWFILHADVLLSQYLDYAVAVWGLVYVWLIQDTKLYAITFYPYWYLFTFEFFIYFLSPTVQTWPLHFVCDKWTRHIVTEVFTFENFSDGEVFEIVILLTHEHQIYFISKEILLLMLACQYVQKVVFGILSVDVNVFVCWYWCFIVLHTYVGVNIFYSNCMQCSVCLSRFNLEVTVCIVLLSDNVNVVPI